MIVCPLVVGSGKRFFPDGVRLDLELAEERRFRKGEVVLRYAVWWLIDVKGWNVTRQPWRPLAASSCTKASEKVCLRPSRRSS